MKLTLKKTTKKVVYPSKKTLNLCVKDKAQLDPFKAIPLAIVIIVLAGIFSKFAVVDRLNELNTAKARISQAQEQVAQLSELTADYEKISNEYAKYSINWMSDSERYLVPRTDMIDLINKELTSSISYAKSVTFSGNTIKVYLYNTNLEATSKLVSKLSSRDDIDSVAVYTASSSNGIDNVVEVVINMVYEQEAQ